jgi:hypothetical protein
MRLEPTIVIDRLSSSLEAVVDAVQNLDALSIPYRNPAFH